MFNMSSLEVIPTFYRKKSPIDEGDQRTGDYVFQTTQPVIVDINFDLSQLNADKKADCIQNLLYAQSTATKAKVTGFPNTKNYKNGTVHYFVVSDVVIDKKPTNQKTV